MRSTKNTRTSTQREQKNNIQQEHIPRNEEQRIKSRGYEIQR